ncbi:MAG: hypothetical protein JOZ72_01405 [Alphaproteobacteria bacterium]|nr:hypothetical protein [Alphaproteobacteria bacterium]
MNDNTNDKRASRLSPAGWVAVVSLLFFLGWAVWYAVHGWNALSGLDIDISTTGWIFLVVGVLATLALGAGLMALVFYSSRKDYDR